MKEPVRNIDWKTFDFLEEDLPANNCSIINYQNRSLMAYRMSGRGGASRVGMLEMVNKKPITSGVTIPCGGAPEDPRLFHFKGGLWMSFTRRWKERGRPYTCKMSVARLEADENGGWHAAEIHTPEYGKNDGKNREKNWVFFEHDGALHFIYQYHPFTIVRLNDDLATPAKTWEHKLKMPGWGGEMRGGTPPVFLGDGRMLTFFHNHTTPKPKHRIYHFGALTFDALPPFAPGEVSENPIYTGNDGFPNKSRTKKVVFPCGATIKNGRVFISAGMNDCRAAITFLNFSDLRFPSKDQAEMPLKRIVPARERPDIHAVFFTYHKDARKVNIAMEAARRLGIGTTAAIDKDDAIMEIEGSRSILTSFDRKGNLNGKEAAIGILNTLEKCGQGREWVLKIDSDGILLDTEWFERHGDSIGVVGCGHAKGSILYGFCYAVRTAFIPGLIKQIESMRCRQENGRPMGEDVIIGKAAHALGILHAYELHESDAPLWAWDHESVSPVRDAVKRCQAIAVQPRDPKRPDRDEVRRVMKNILNASES